MQSENPTQTHQETIEESHKQETTEPQETKPEETVVVDISGISAENSSEIKVEQASPETTKEGNEECEVRSPTLSPASVSYI